MENINAPLDDLHQKAMELADEAFYAKKKENFEEAQTKYLLAFEYEKAAAMLLLSEYRQEPTRSVLFRSAASLLLSLPSPTYVHFRNAEQMVAYGLSGNPPEEIATELRAAWGEVMGFFKEAA